MRVHGTAVNCTRWVTSCRQTQSRKSVGSTRSWRSTLTMFGATSSNWPSGRSKNSNWPSTLPDRKPTIAPAWTPVTRPPTASPKEPTLPALLSRSTSGVMTVFMPAVLTSIQPCRSTTRVSAVTGGSLSSVISATWPAATSASSYSWATTASAAARSVGGGDGLSRLAVLAASSQLMSAAIGRA